MPQPWNFPINAFNGGELSPSLYGRTDLAKYASSAKTIKNFLIQPEGGLVRRSGTRFVKPLQDEATAIRLVPFIFSTTQAYVLGFGNLFMKVYKDEGVVLNTAENVEGITNANPAVVTITGHPFSNGDEVYIASVGGMTELNGRFYTVANKTADTFELSGIDSTGYGAYTTGGTCASVYKLTTPYTTAQVAQMTFAQSADTLYVAHQSHAPRKITRSAHNNWSISTVDFRDGPYPYLNYTPTSMNPNTGVVGATATVTASSTEGINDGDGFQDPQDVGRHLRIEKATTTADIAGYIEITHVDSTTQVRGTVIAEFSAATTRRWRLSAWYTGNYPAAVSFGNGRLWWGGEPGFPIRFFGSQSSDFESFSPTEFDSSATADNNAISYAIGANQVDNILWVEVGRNILIGTPGGVLPVQASTPNEAITPSSINIPAPMPYGAAALRPTRVGTTVVYVDRTQRALRGVVFSVEADAYAAIDLTRRSRHLSLAGLEGVAYQLMPDSIVWCWKSDGTIAALTYVPEEDVLAWSRHEIGGSFGSGGAVVESMAAIPMPDDSGDQVWMVVKRTIDGETRRYVEFFEEKFERDDDIEDGFFVDCGLTYDSTPATTISGLLHLEGEEVAILADGLVVEGKTVSDGQITLDKAASKVHIGFAYDSDVESLRLDVPATAAPDGRGTSRGARQRVNTVVARFDATNAGLYGPDEDHLSPIPFRDTLDLLDTPTPLFSGDKDLTIEPGWSRESAFFFRQDKPLPFNLLSVTALGETGAR